MIDCFHPIAPDDEALLQFVLDGEALPEEVSRHLEQCAICQQRLASYKNDYSFLVSHLYRSQCPDGTTLSLYCAGLLPADERTRIANHLMDCPLCAAEAADTRKFLADTADTDLLPSSFLFPFPALRTTVHRIFATLVKQQAQLVVRGDAIEGGWPRQYRAESIDLSLHLAHASSGEYMLLGIITDPTENIEAFEGLTAELYPAPEPLAADGDEDAKKPLRSTQVDDIGNILFSAVPVGEYVMIVHLPDRELVIEGVTISPG